MAWQNSVGMVGNGGASGGSSEAGASSGQAQGTEYTLQGTDPRRDSKVQGGVDRWYLP